MPAPVICYSDLGMFGISSAAFSCDKQVYHLPLLQVSLKYFACLNHFGSVYGDADVSLI